jgi:queuine/archaeosine tRNA-ribosyltransferase
LGAEIVENASSTIERSIDVWRCSWRNKHSITFTINRYYCLLFFKTVLPTTTQSIDFVYANEFEGVAIGGSLGATREEMYNLIEETISPAIADKTLHFETRPIHLLVSIILLRFFFVTFHSLSKKKGDWRSF